MQWNYISPVAQVLDWLEKHGEVFLRKNVGIGRNLAKSRAYQKSHETFEGVVQVWGSRILLHRNTELKPFEFELSSAFSFVEKLCVFGKFEFSRANYDDFNGN